MPSETSSRLRVNGCDLSFNGNFYTVRVTAGTASHTYSSGATLTVVNNFTPVAISSQPQSSTVVVGNTATFSVSATGTPPLTYQWSKNSIAIAGASNPSYSTPATSYADNGSAYSVTVTGPTNSVISSNATLTVTALPTITISTQPSSTSVIAGGTATFGVNASVSNNASETYQWYLNGTAISGATQSSYTTPVLTVANSGGQYTVKVSSLNLVTLTSSVATLTVTPAPISNATALEQIKIALLSAGIADGAINAFDETLSSGNVEVPACNTGSVAFKFDNVTRTVTTLPVLAVPVGQHSLSAVYANCVQTGNTVSDTNTENGTNSGSYNFSNVNGSNLNGTGVVTFTNRSSKNNTTNTISTINGNTNLTSTESKSSSTQMVSGNQIMTVANSSSRGASPVSGTVQFALGNGGASGTSSYLSGSANETYSSNAQYNATTEVLVSNSGSFTLTYNNLTSLVGADTYTINGTLSATVIPALSITGSWTISRNGIAVGTVSYDNNNNMLVTINGVTSVLSGI